MTSYLWLLTIPIFIGIGIFINWMSDSSKDFSELIESELKSKGMKLISCTYPGIFRVGPFEKFQISIGTPQVNGQSIQKSYYRIVELKTKNNKTKKIWVRITTHWLKDTKIEFSPKLSEVEK